MPGIEERKRKKKKKRKRRRIDAGDKRKPRGGFSD